MPRMGEVNADLMRAPGFEVAHDVTREHAKAFCHAVMGHGRLAPTLPDGVTLPCAGVAPQGTRERARQGMGDAHNQRLVTPPEGPVRELGRKSTVRGIVFGDDHQTARVLIKAMDDSRTRDAADPTEVGPAVGEQRVDERSVPMPYGGVDDESSGLVDHQQVRVFVDNLQRNRLGFRRCGRGGGQMRGVRLTWVARRVGI